jgi:predicted ester cyclase
MSVPAGRADLLERFYVNACSHGEVDVLDEILVADFVATEATSSARLDREGLKRRIVELRSALPDLRIRVERVVAGGDEVAVAWCAEGTFTAALRGRQPTGRRVEASGLTIHRFAHGRIAAHWSRSDLPGLTRGLFIVPSRRRGTVGR